MLASLRRSLAFRRKVRVSGLRIVGTGVMPVGDILWRREDRPEREAFTVERSPHMSLLHHYAAWGDTMWDYFPHTAYYRWHIQMRGYQHPRPDKWIEAMARRLIRLYESIKQEGYRCRCVADRIAVKDGKWLWDGGHRLACLAVLGWKEVPVVWLEERQCR